MTNSTIRLLFIIAIALSSTFTNGATLTGQTHPWNANTREHLFGGGEVREKPIIAGYDRRKPEIKKCDELEGKATVGDEGFRWRGSFNFRIDDSKISEWKFYKTPELWIMAGMEMVRKRGFRGFNLISNESRDYV